MASRYAGLFQSVLGIDVSERVDSGEGLSSADWAALATAMAISNRAAGFEIDLQIPAANRRMGDDQNSRDAMMDTAIWCKWIEDDRGRWRWIKADQRQMTDVEASKRVEKFLDRERDIYRKKLRDEGLPDDVPKVPKATSIRSQYSQRNNEAIAEGRDPWDRKPPRIAHAYLRARALSDALNDVAQRLGHCATLHADDNAVDSVSEMTLTPRF